MLQLAPLFLLLRLVLAATTDTIATTSSSLDNDINNTTTTTTMTSTANSDNLTPFQLSVQPTLYECEDAVLTWSGGNTVPLYEVYYAEGTGESGNDAILGEEKWLGAVSGNNFTWSIDPSWKTQIGDVIRFRVADNYGKGQNATTWSKVVAGSVECYASAPALAPQSSLFVSVPQVETTTIKPSASEHAITSVETPKATTDSASPTPVPESTSTPVPATTDDSETVRPTAGGDDSTGSDQQASDNQQANDQPVVTTAQGSVTFTLTGGSSLHQTVTPAVVAANSGKDDTAHVNLPPKAIGAIVGSLIGAIVLWILFMLWLRRRKNTRKFHQMEESTAHSPLAKGARKTLTPISIASYNPFNSSSKPSLSVEEAGSSSSPIPGSEPRTYSQFLTTPTAYTATGDTFSALNSPDPFRRSFGVPTVL